MAEGDGIPRPVEVANELASGAWRLASTRIWRVLNVNSLGHASSEYVGKVESVEDFPKSRPADPLDGGSRHMRLTETFDRLDRYVRGRLARGDLQLWLEQESWDARPSYAREVALHVLLLFAEADNGDFPEAVLRQRIAGLIAPKVGLGIAVGSKIEAIEVSGRATGVKIQVAPGRPDPLVESVRPDPKSQRSGIDIHERQSLVVQ